MAWLAWPDPLTSWRAQFYEQTVEWQLALLRDEIRLYQALSNTVGTESDPPWAWTLVVHIQQRWLDIQMAEVRLARFRLEEAQRRAQEAGNSLRVITALRNRGRIPPYLDYDTLPPQWDFQD